MCHPMVLVGIQAGAQIAGGIAQQKAGKQAAIQAEREAIYQQQAAAAETENIRYANKRELGSLRAAFGTRGVGLDSASMIDVIAESAGNLDYPALVKEHEGIIARYRGAAEARAARAAGRNAFTRSLLDAASTVAQGAIKPR
ncbi:MAG: hypothetical protein ACKVRO_08670 [Micropepsaceae bacterium]